MFTTLQSMCKGTCRAFLLCIYIGGKSVIPLDASKHKFACKFSKGPARRKTYSGCLSSVIFLRLLCAMNMQFYANVYKMILFRLYYIKIDFSNLLWCSELKHMDVGLLLKLPDLEDWTKSHLVSMQQESSLYFPWCFVNF